MGPRPVYCPTANSMNNIGIPHMTKMIKYGIRNTPGRVKNKKNLKNPQLNVD